MKKQTMDWLVPKAVAALLVVLSCVMVLGVTRGETQEPVPPVQAPPAGDDAGAKSDAGKTGKDKTLTGFNVPETAAKPGAYRLRDAYPNLRFDMPMAVIDAGDGTMFVAENFGRLWRFNKDRQASEKTLVLDLRPNMSKGWPYTDGLQGIALHPEFGKQGSPNRGSIFVFYPGYDGKHHYSRVSRFELPDGKDKIELKTEKVMIQQIDRYPAQHLGGGIAFGPDGFLYFALGDEGGSQDKNGESQSILAEAGIFSGVFRIDVDKKGGDVSYKPKNFAPGAVQDGYYIPKDNPFVDEQGGLGEYYALGLRNPFRMTFDRKTGKLWLGEVGHERIEEVNLVEPGDNFGWSYIEGDLEFRGSALKGKKPEKYYGTEKAPFYQYPHTENNACVVGGYVYRGKKYPELYRKYIFGDNLSGRVWAMDIEGGKFNGLKELAVVQSFFSSGLLSFGEDKDGELLICEGGTPGKSTGRLLELVPTSEAEQASRFPEKLSDTGLFTDTEKMTPAQGMVMYTVNSPLWSDGAAKKRWFVLPRDGKIGYSQKGEWRFPAGTIFVKHFELPNDARDKSKVHRLETRLIIRETNGDAIFGATYRWNEAQTDAYLLPDGHSEMIKKIDKNGNATEQKWAYPTRLQCTLCHNRNSGYVLGLNTRQFNGPGPELGPLKGDNQVEALSKLGLFDKEVTPNDIGENNKLVALGDEGASLEVQARSYMDANCSHCHRPGGILPNKMEARWHAEWETGAPTVAMRKRAIKRMSIKGLKDENAQTRMPLLGMLKPNQASIKLMKDWHLSEIPASVHAGMYAMCVGVCLVLLMLVWRSTGSLKLGVLAVVLGIGWMLAVHFVAEAGVFEQRFKKVWLDWLLVPAVVLAGVAALALPGVRRAVAQAPQWVMIGGQVLRLTALVLLPLAGLSYVEQSYTKAVYTELAIAVAAVLVALLIAKCGRGRATKLMVLAWNLIGLVGLLYLAKSIATPSEWVMHRSPVVLYTLVGAPLLVLLHLYSAYAALVSTSGEPAAQTPEPASPAAA